METEETNITKVKQNLIPASLVGPNYVFVFYEETCRERSFLRPYFQLLSKYIKSLSLPDLISPFLRAQFKTLWFEMMREQSNYGES